MVQINLFKQIFVNLVPLFLFFRAVVSVWFYYLKFALYDVQQRRARLEENCKISIVRFILLNYFILSQPFECYFIFGRKDPEIQKLQNHLNFGQRLNILLKA